MSLSKTTKNFASRRGFDVIVDTHTVSLANGKVIERDCVFVRQFNDDNNIDVSNDYVMAYYINGDGSFTYCGTCFPDKVDDASAYLKDEKALRNVIEQLQKVLSN